MNPRRPLYWQIFPLFLGVVMLALAAVSAYSTAAMEGFFLEQTRSELTARGRLLIPQLPNAMDASAAALKRMFSIQGKTSGTRITLVLPSGVVLADSDHDPAEMENHAARPEIAAALTGKDGSAVRFSRTLRKRMMYVALPIRRTDGTVGAVIRTALSVSAIDEKLDAIRLRILAGGLAVAALAVVLSMLVSKRISRPIEDIKSGAERFAAGDLHRQLPIPDTAELANLARTNTRIQRIGLNSQTKRPY